MKIMDENNVEYPEKDRMSSVKVTKNSKGYNWEIKVYNDDPEVAFNETVKLELKCKEKWHG